MLELKHIAKDYPAEAGCVHALQDVSLQFRESEFVAILGPSGCGKTTMLNIIGGLDQYSGGDLVINGKSTKDFKDRDWDGYRNHSIGFVFQSYNLIPHQTVLQNVELALTLSGVSKSARRKRAIAALEEVGLGDQLRKKPSQMSGGQMQRVAIARALVNNPDIVLADEPTGALDTQTSVQVMEILKEVAKSRLVIMVTHNPDLAETYATRTIRMLDGRITDDSAPLCEQEQQTCRAADAEKVQKGKKERKPSMSLGTAFGLSFKNLISKKGRTVLTSFAGSIGIIGIALIFAVSQGMTIYINNLQEDTLSSYPLTIQATHVDIGSLMAAFLDNAHSGEPHEKDAVYTKPLIYDMINALNSMETTKNDLTAFKAFLEDQLSDHEGENGLYEALSGVQYTYDLELPIYTKNVDDKIILSDTQTLLQAFIAEHMGMNMAGGTDAFTQSSSMSGMMSMGSSGMNLWQEMLPGKDGKLISDLLEKQYDVVYGSWPNAYNEIVLVLDENNELDDITLYALGLKPKADIDAIMQAAMNKTPIQPDGKSWSYEQICNMEFRTVLPANCYVLEESTGLFVDLRETDTGLRYLYDNAEVLKVSGIIRPSEEAVSSMITGSIGYTAKLTEYVISQAGNSEVVKAQLENPAVDIFTGLPFKDRDDTMGAEEKEEKFREYIRTLGVADKAEAYVRIMSIPTQQQLDSMVSGVVGNMTREDMEKAMIQAMTSQMGMSEKNVAEYIGAMSDGDITKLFTEMVTEQAKMQYAAQVKAQLAPMSPEQLAGALDLAMKNYTATQCAQYYDEVLEFSESGYEENLILLGCLDLDEPAAINLFAASFESKDQIEAAIAAYNEDAEELSQIKYTDYVGLMMSSVTSIINAITYVLIAFVSISLVVSSIMIGVITLISVQERTKEIGILRAIGASKKNVSSMFNMETVIIGFTAGALGVAVTFLLCFPINAIIQALTGIKNLRAYLPMEVAVLLVAISMLLTVFAGIIPSRSAAKKDPVVALRTE